MKGGLVMQQRQLFGSEEATPDGGEAASFPIHSGQAGRVRFGATEASFTLTGQALADLAAASGVSPDPQD